MPAGEYLAYPSAAPCMYGRASLLPRIASPTSPTTLHCPFCRTAETVLNSSGSFRRKVDRLPGNADERDRAKFKKAESYMVLITDKVLARTCDAGGPSRSPASKLPLPGGAIQAAVSSKRGRHGCEVPAAFVSVTSPSYSAGVALNRERVPSERTARRTARPRRPGRTS
jgi:hypothetical protein